MSTAKLMAALGLASFASLACAETTETRIQSNLTYFKLDNGVNVFVYPRKSAPLFAGMLYVDAGSAEEEAGHTGIAHLLEHMAFKGTPWVGTKDWAAERSILIEIEKAGAALTRARQQKPVDEKKVEELSARLSDLQRQAAALTVPNEYDNIITREGGQEVNATTSADYTNYFMTVPANKLELWAMMESERLLYPSWREFYQERDVVAEERRMRTEDSPTGRLWEQFVATAFQSHPYQNPVIGWMPDIQNLTVQATDEFYKKWYVPENYVIALVGDVDPDTARPVLQKYFGSIPSKPSPPKAITVEAPQLGERRIQINFDSEPQAMIGWHKPTFPDKDMYVFEVIQFILTQTGRSSRLYERLVKQDGICKDVDTFTGPGDKYPNLFIVYLSTQGGATIAQAEKAVYEEIERLKGQPLSDEELEKIRNQIDASFLTELETNLGFARKLGNYFLASRDPNIIDTMRDEMKKVTPQDIMRVTQKYFTADNRTVAEIVTRREQKPSDAPVPATGQSISPEEDTTTATLGN